MQLDLKYKFIYVDKNGTQSTELTLYLMQFCPRYHLLCMVTAKTTVHHPSAHIRATSSGCECRNWIQVAQSGGQCRALVNTEMMFGVPKKKGNLLRNLSIGRLIDYWGHAVA